MNEPIVPEETGKIRISEEVVATIAGIACSEFEGINSMSGGVTGGIAEFLGAKRGVSKGIKVDIKENDAIIDIHIVVNYGVKIPDIAWAIQERVKAEVEKMTGLNVKKVNIHVDGVNIEKKRDEAETKAEDDEE